MRNTYSIPNPIIDDYEVKSLNQITEKYEKMLEPNTPAKIAGKVGELIPQGVKDIASKAKDSITEQEVFIKSMEVLAKGFKQVEALSAKYTLSRNEIVKRVNDVVKENDVTTVDEICLARSYDIKQLVEKYKLIDLSAALIEGAAFGFVGFAGLPFNLVLSTFLYYRAVQSVALFYGFDVKNNPSELEIASEVFSNAMSPKNNNDSELSSIIAKVMLITETTTVKQAMSKSWTDIASKGGACLLIAQMRALANASARKALERAGKKGLEESAFKNIFEQIGKKLAKDSVKKAAPIVGALIGATIDTAQMNQIINYANLFYCKRFILEKENNINVLLGYSSIFNECSNIEIDIVEREDKLHV